MGNGVEDPGKRGGDAHPHDPGDRLRGMGGLGERHAPPIDVGGAVVDRQSPLSPEERAEVLKKGLFLRRTSPREGQDPLGQEEGHRRQLLVGSPPGQALGREGKIP